LIIIKPTLDNLAAYHDLARQLSQHYHRHCVTLDELKTIGLALWQVLKQDATLRPQPQIIECDDKAVLALPWECVYHPELGFLGKHPDYTLSRRVSSDKALAMPPTGPLNILLFTAQPEKNTARLDLEIEQHSVREALQPFIHAGKVQFYAPHDGRFNTLVELLHQKPWHLVLLSGHGIIKADELAFTHSETFKAKFQGDIRSKLKTLHKLKRPLAAVKAGRQAVSTSEAAAYFVFEGEQGEGELISAHTLADVFKGTTVQCVVMAACQSAHFSADNPEANLIMPLVQAGIPHLIGMREPLIDRAGSVFVRTLCKALAQQARIDEAVQQGRRAMRQLLATNEVWHNAQSAPDPSLVQWCLPTLVSQAPTQALVNWDFSPQVQPPVQIGSKIALPKIFIGRRRELRTLGEGLYSGTIQRLLIQGKGGLGKTALAGQLAITLAQQGYRILAYQAGNSQNFQSTLKQALNLLSASEDERDKTEFARFEADLETHLKTIAQEKWVFWLDNLERLQNPDNGSFTDKTLQNTLGILSQWETPQLRILLTARRAIAQSTDYHNYLLNRPNFNDFSRHLENQGLHYFLPERLQIYQTLSGNFQGIQLLQSLSPSQDAITLKKQLILVRRYLQAYLRL